MSSYFFTISLLITFCIGCGDVLTNKPIEKALAPIKGNFYIVQKDDTIKVLADREIHFFNADASGEYNKFRDKIIDNEKNNILNLNKERLNSVISLTNKLESLPDDIKSNYKLRATLALEEKVKFEDELRQIISNGKSQINKLAAKIANVNSLILDFESKSVNYHNLDSQIKKRTKTHFNKTKSISLNLINSLNRQIKSNNINIDLLEEDLAEIGSAHISNNSYIYDFLTSKIQDIRMEKDDYSSYDVRTHGASLFSNKKIQDYSYDASRMFYFFASSGILGKGYYVPQNLPMKMPLNLQRESISAFNNWYDEVKDYAYYTESANKSLILELNKLIPWKNAISKDLLDEVLKANESNSSIFYRNNDKKTPIDIYAEFTKFKNILNSQLTEIESVVESRTSNIKGLISKENKIIENGDHWIDQELSRQSTPIHQQISILKKAISESKNTSDNLEISFRLEPEQLIATINNFAFQSIRTDIDGKFSVPKGSKFLFTKITRLNNEELLWLYIIPEGIEKIELKNSNTISLPELQVQFNEIINN